MTVRVTVDGRTATARETYHSFIGYEDPRDMPAYLKEQLGASGVDPGSFDAEDAGIIVDGTVFYKGPYWKISSETGSADQSGFGFGGLDASLSLGVREYDADRSFEVRRAGETEYGTDAWVTTVDGEVVNRGEQRPFLILWRSGGSARDDWFGGEFV